MRAGSRGFTYLELVATAAILAVLAAAILPTARVMRQRQKELELRRTLRELRTAIDAFKLDADQNRIAGTCVKLGNENYPESLEFMVEGCVPPGRVDGVKRRWLRRIPLDPLTGSNEWGLRCYQDEADEDSWCGDNVYDVYTQSRATALDGSKYRDW